MAHSVITLCNKYKITESECKEEVCDSLLEKISRSLTGEWRSLPCCLQMGSSLVDIDRNPGTEIEKRLSFLRLWHQRKGSDAIYKTLISALLEIECMLDAENVCKLLHEFFSKQPHQQNAGHSAPSSIIGESSQASANTGTLLTS